MANSSIQGRFASSLGGTVSISTNDPEYLSYIGSLLGGGALVFSREGGDEFDLVSVRMPFSGSIRRLSAKIMENERIASTTLTVLLDGEDTECSVVFDGGETGDKTGTGSVSFVEGQRIALRFTVAVQDEEDPDYTSDELQLSAVWCEVVGDTGVYVSYTTGRDTSPLSDFSWSDEYVGPISGQRLAGTTSGSRDFAAWRLGMIEPTTERGFVPTEVNPNSPPPAITDESTLLSPATVQFGVDGALVDHEVIYALSFSPGSTTVTDHAGTVGVLVDGSLASNVVERYGGASEWVRSARSSDVVAIADGDLVAGTLRFPSGVPTTDEKQDIIAANYWFRSDDQRYDVFTYGDAAAHNTTGAITLYGGYTGTTYHPIFTNFLFSVVRDFRDWVEIPIPVCMTFSNLRVRVTNYTGNPGVITLLKDGVATALTVTVNGNGLFEYTSSSVDFECGEAACFRVYVASGTFNAYIQFLGMTHEVAGECVCAECDCYPECPNSLTVCDLRERTLRMLGEDTETPAYWSADEIDNYISDANIEAARESGALELVEALELAADSSAASMSDQVGRIMRATFDDRKIENTTNFALDRSEFSWEGQSGYVSGYVHTLHDTRTMSTFKAWDGTTSDAAYEHFYNDAYAYSAWLSGDDYVDGDRVTVTDSDGIKRGYVCTADHTSAAASQPGTGADWTDYWSPLVLCVWAKKIPAAISECDVSELPPWFHLALAYKAASRALRKYGEQRNDNMAKAYEAIYDDYLRLLKGYVSNRTPERTVAIGRGRRGGVRRPQPYDQVIEG